MTHLFKQLLPVCFLACLFPGVPNSSAADIERYAEKRHYMVEEIRQDVVDTSYYINKKNLDPRVMSVMGRVERHKFVPMSERSSAYANHPLPIGHGQTISQPYIVALMTDLLDIKPGDKVLEVGTGSGYQAAVLAEMGAEVCTIEIIHPLADEARQRLSELGYERVKARQGDGYYGWQEEAPFDAIIVTAASGHVPPPLIRQLKNGGVIVIPVGSKFTVQHLLLVTKNSPDDVSVRQILPVRFVPLTGDH